MTALSAVITVATAGTPVQGPDLGLGTFLVLPDPVNTGYVYVGNNGSGTVSSTTGFKLPIGGSPIFVTGNLNSLWFDASVNAQKITVLKVESLLSN
jgi:hypothetical protein